VRMLRRAFFDFVHPNCTPFQLSPASWRARLHRLYEHPPEVALAIQVAELAGLTELSARAQGGHADLVRRSSHCAVAQRKALLSELPPRATLHSRCELLLVCCCAPSTTLATRATRRGRAPW